MVKLMAEYQPDIDNRHRSADKPESVTSATNLSIYVRIAVLLFPFASVSTLVENGTSVVFACLVIIFGLDSHCRRSLHERHT